MAVLEENYLAHYGILRKSGRYPWGSGKDPATRSRTFLGMVDELKKKGLTEEEVARGFSTPKYPFTVKMLRDTHSIAVAERRQDKVNQIQRLADKGWGNSAIAKRMGMNESSVRSMLTAGRKDRALVLASTVNMLRDQVAKKQYLDVGKGTEKHLGITRTKFEVAVAVLKDEGYKTHYVKEPQLGVKGQYTTRMVLTKPGVPYSDVWKNRGQVQLISDYSNDGGRSYTGILPPLSISSKRIAINYGDQGGATADGVIYVRPGVPDLSMGQNHYAQVRIAVDGTHYLKGMAVQKDDIPKGVDLVFNTKKSDTGNKHDAMKEMSKDPDNPFGSMIDHQITEKGPNGKDRVTSVMNILNEEGSWDEWSKSLPAQMLSKQSEELARRQLAVTFERRNKEFESISELTNPTIRKFLLTSFANETDSAAVHLKAASIRGQATKVLLPISKIKETEIYAPSFRNGDRVALVRFPHGGPFEIPELTVNNRNQEARKALGTAAKDAVGIHYKVAQHLSGADFDGDTVLVIPNNRGDITASPALDGLKGFDPQHAYPAYDGMKTVDGGVWREATHSVDYGGKKPSGKLKQTEMGKVTNLITDMSVQGANTDELARAVRHSMVIIDSEKHCLNYKASAVDNGIAQLKVKYQRRVTPEGKVSTGAATLLSRSSSDVRVPARRPRYASEGGPIDPATGRKMFVPTGEKYVNKQGQTVVKTVVSKAGAETEDAFALSKGTDMETVYATHANQLKQLANDARKEIVQTPNIVRSSSAARVYAPQVESLNSKLNLALRNAPLERQAQAIAGAKIRALRESNPELDQEDLDKVGYRALEEARVRTGAQKNKIQITKDEWDAIQAGAISNSKLIAILNNGDIDNIRQHATPRSKILMTPNMKARADQMIANGYTQQEVADGLGVSLSTLKASIYEGK